VIIVFFASFLFPKSLIEISFKINTCGTKRSTLKMFDHFCQHFSLKPNQQLVNFARGPFPWVYPPCLVDITKNHWEYLSHGLHVWNAQDSQDVWFPFLRPSTGEACGIPCSREHRWISFGEFRWDNKPEHRLPKKHICHCTVALRHNMQHNIQLELCRHLTSTVLGMA